MPLPSPKKGESSDKFISRCMRDKQAKRDFPDQKQRLAVCFTRLRKKRPSIKRSIAERLNELRQWLFNKKK